MPESVYKRMSSITPFTALKWWTTASQHVTGAQTLCKMIWEMLNIFSLPPPLCFLKLASCQKQDWFASICKVDVPHLRANALFCEFSTFFMSLWFRCRQGEDHLGQISVLDTCGDNVDRNVCKMLCFRQYCKWINLFTLENGCSAFKK